MPPLQHLDLFLDATPHPAPMNMAIDEALLRASPTTPILRIYGWERPASSFGYSQPWQQIQRQAPPEREAVRRWTGGGLVLHGDPGELTYTLVIPRTEPLSRVPILDSYHQIHQSLIHALRSFGLKALLAPAPAEGAPNLSCFDPAGGHAEPAQFDVLHDGRKIAGAAQRRHRLGLLHQGSLRVPSPLDPTHFAEAFAEQLAQARHLYSPSPALRKAAENLSATRYACPDWLQRL